MNFYLLFLILKVVFYFPRTNTHNSSVLCIFPKGAQVVIGKKVHSVCQGVEDFGER